MEMQLASADVATYRVVGDDHAVEQRAHGVEAAHVQACRVVKNTGE